MCVGDQAKTIRYQNSECCEIGVKYNRNKETVIIVENPKQKKEFVFYPEDDQTLFYFESILTNLLGFYYTFDMNYGRKQNQSESIMTVRVYNKNGDSLEIAAIKGLGVTVEIKVDTNLVAFTFSPDEKNLLEMFKLDLSHVIKNSVPKITAISTNITNDAESPHTFKRAEAA